MSCVAIARAILVRLLFAVHGLVAVWLLANVTKEPRYWYIASALGLLLLELTITLGKKGGKEWKWFCPSVFIYLLCMVPAIWFLELHEMDKRIEKRRTSNLTTIAQEFLRNQGVDNLTEDDPQGEELFADLGNLWDMNFEIRIPLRLRSEEWIKMLEQMLLLLLILGRWLLPKGKLTHDQLSQLLLVYIGTAADIVEFFDAFKEEVVKYEPILCMSILGIWSFSLIQFCLVLTASRARRDQSGLVPIRRAKKTAGEGKGAGCCSADVYGIIISIVLQDGPFLVLRLLLIFKYNVLSYTNMFFTSKNTIVIVLLLYRLVVVQIEKRRECDEESETALLKERGRRLAECASLTPSSCSGKSRLVNSGSSYSNGFYAPSRSTTPHRDVGLSASMGSIARHSLAGSAGDNGTVGGGGGGREGAGTMRRGTIAAAAGRWNRTYTVDNLNSPV
ncbi:transmembrane protein 26-like [Littorina saxatilis]|uniref:Transmembrane protein 26 n=1 Tax=Littorina saxatilis TaxID=31220 RepID=A0AAN9ATW8_9CAEN